MKWMREIAASCQVSHQCSTTELRPPDNHQPSQPSTHTAQVVLTCTICSCCTPSNGHIFMFFYFCLTSSKCLNSSRGRCLKHFPNYDRQCSSHEYSALGCTFPRSETRLSLPQGQHDGGNPFTMRNLTQEMSVIPVLWPLTLSDPLSASLSFQPFLLERNHLGGTPAFWVPFQKLTVCKNTDIKCVRLYSKQTFDDMRWSTGSHKNWQSQELTQSFLHWSRMF